MLRRMLHPAPILSLVTALTLGLGLVGASGAESHFSASAQAAASTATIPDKISSVPGQKLTVMQFNFAGNGFNGGSVTEPVSDIVKKIAQLQPDIITFNEICVKQAAAIWTQLRALPGYGNLYKQSVKTNYEVPNCDNGVAGYTDDDYAMSIMSRWRMTLPNTVGDGGFYKSFSVVYPTRYRRILCVNVDVNEDAGNKVMACTTHLEEAQLMGTDPATSASVNINEAQSAEVASTMAALAPANRIILGGDFNLLPNDTRLDALYGADAGGSGIFTEADQYDWRWSDGLPASRAGDITFAPVLVDDEIPGNLNTGTRKLDYIFAESSAFTVAQDSASVIPSSYSDHLILVSRIALK